MITRLNVPSVIDNGETIEGSTRNVEMIAVEDVEKTISLINYPLPPVEICLLPFTIDKINGVFVAGDGYAVYKSKRIYLGALDLISFVDKESALKSAMKTLAHELGHMVHYAYMDIPTWGELKGDWLKFAKVHGVTFSNDRYDTATHEAFAESWRMIFAPSNIPHRQNLTIPEGLREWMLSLDGSLVLRPDHMKAYKAGNVIEIDKAPRIEDGRTMVPLRHISQLMGHNVDWDGQSIIIR